MTAMRWGTEYIEIRNDEALGLVDNMIDLCVEGYKFGVIERDIEDGIYVAVGTKAYRRSDAEMRALNAAYRFGSDVEAGE